MFSNFNKLKSCLHQIYRNTPFCFDFFVYFSFLGQMRQILYLHPQSPHTPLYLGGAAAGASVGAYDGGASDGGPSDAGGGV